MEFDVHKRFNKDLGPLNEEAMKISREFSKRMYDEFGSFLKAVVLFGSSAKKDSGHDIDVLVIVDDVTVVLGSEVAESYRIIVEKIIIDVSRRLHVTTLRLTTFWEYMRAGDPIAINILRDGIALLDTGFFDPLKLMLIQGRVRPTKESIWTYMSKAPAAIQKADKHILSAFVDLYWAVMDSAHAALMAHNKTPPTPEHVSNMIAEHFVKKKLAPASATSTAKKFYDIMKRIERAEIGMISGKDFDAYKKEAVEFTKTMRVVMQKGQLSV